MSNAVAMQTQGRVSTRVSAKVAFGKTAEAHRILDIVKTNFPEYGQFWDYTRDFITVEEQHAKGDYAAALTQLRDMWQRYPQYKRAMFSRAQHIMADMEVELLREMREIHALLLGGQAELTHAQIVDRVADILDLYRELWDKYPTKKHHKLIAQRAEMLAAMVRQLTSPPRRTKKAPVIISRIPGPLTYYVYKDPITGEWVTPDDPTITEIGPTGQCAACGAERTVIDASRAEAQKGRCETCHEENRPLFVRRPKRITPYRPPLAA